MAHVCYTYTYRDSSGKVKEGTVYGSSRADAFASLKAAGIRPISLNVSGAVAQRSLPRSGFLFGSASLLIIVVAVGCIWAVVHRETPPPPAALPSAVPLKAAPKQGRVAVSNQVTDLPKVKNAMPPPQPSSTPREALTEYRGKKVVSYAVNTNAEGAIIERYWTEDGNTHSIVTDPPPVFENSSDQILAMALSVPQGGELPPLPIPSTMDKDFLDSLSKPIVIDEEDSDAVRKLKEDVIAARKDMQELLKSGGSAAEILQEHRRLLNENTATRNQVIKELRAIIDSGDIKGAEKYVRTMNVALGQMGIMEISMPRSAEARARRATTHKTVQDRNPENNQ